MSATLSLTSTLSLLPSNTIKIPRLGLGVYKSHGSKCIDACLNAFRVGYRHIDTAQFYGNEAEVGTALNQSGLQRSDVFVTTKIMAAGGSVQHSYEKCVGSVEKIDPGEAGYVDLFLVHSPRPGPAKRKEMWLALEKLYEEGKVKSIGVSNYGVAQIEEMKGYAKVWPPHVNQIELHPWCQQRVINEYCQQHGVAKGYGKTTAQILIRYSLQKGWVGLPKSETPSRIQENAEVYDFEISSADMQTLDDLDQGEYGAIVQAVTNS